MIFKGGNIVIIGIRVDHRLVHGQVAFSWVTAVNANCILVANDAAASDEMQMTALRLVAPQGVKIVIKSVADSIQQINAGKTDKYRLLVIVKNVHDGWSLVKGCPAVKELNVGGTDKVANSEQLAASVFLSQADKVELKELANQGINVFSQMVPNDKKIDLIKKI